MSDPSRVVFISGFHASVRNPAVENQAVDRIVCANSLGFSDSSLTFCTAPVGADTPSDNSKADHREFHRRPPFRSTTEEDRIGEHDTWTKLQQI